MDELQTISDAVLQAVAHIPLQTRRQERRPNKQGVLKTYPGLPHGMCTTHADMINPDLLAFVQG